MTTPAETAQATTAILESGAIMLGAALLFVTARIDAANLYPSLNPLRWPELSPWHAGALLLGVLPAWLAPPPVTTTQARMAT